MHYQIGSQKKKQDHDSIVEESLRWVKANEGYKLTEVGGYGSPRISSEIMDCSMPMTFDHFNFCSLGCLYCFAYFFKSNNPVVKEVPSLRAVDTKRMINAMQGHPATIRDKALYKHFYSKKFLLHWGGLADPFCNFEMNNKVGVPLLEALGEMSYPTLFSFKGSALLSKGPYLKIFERYASQRNFAFQISMVTGDDELAKKVEIGVPPPSTRLKMIKMLSDMGYWTILRLRPYIIGVTGRCKDQCKSLEELLYAALNAGIRGVSMEFFAMDVRANLGMKDRYEWLTNVLDLGGLGDKSRELTGYFRKLSPPNRGSYRRLFRYMKEFHVRKVYEFCTENNLVFGCSDPDFKELNTSGSCCAMPDVSTENPELGNWTHDQLTYHLKEARRLYHSTGHLVELKFSKVYTKKATWLDETHFRDDHVGVVGMASAVRKQMLIRQMIREHWNNLDSPANPRNYFHNKVLPIGVDNEGNLVFVYNPMEYESDWVKEGIDLTK